MNPRVLFVFTFALTLATAAFSGDAKKDTEKLQGKWTRTFEDEGKKFTIDLVFEGDKFTITFPGEKGKGTFKLDPSKSPKEIDMVVSESVGKEFVGKTSLGIYAFDGESLKWCANEPGKKARPKEFPKSESDAKKDIGFMYVIFKKVK